MAKTIADHIRGITQEGQAVPPGYTFDPRQSPELFRTKPEPESPAAESKDGDKGDGKKGGTA